MPSAEERKRSLANSARSTWNAKLYLGRKAGRLEAVIGSANLTGGLWTNVEAAVSLRGHASDVPLRRAPEGPTTSGHPRAA
jgi:hypothetical protein